MRQFLFAARKWPLLARLLCVILSFVVLEAVVVWIDITRGDDRGIATILLITGIIAAWLLRPWVALSIDLGLLLVFAAIHVRINGWSIAVPGAVFVGVFIDMLTVWSFATLIRALDKIKELTAIKELFLANVNHEMRTPLMSLIWCLELLEENNHDDLTHGELVHKAISCSKELEQFVNNISIAIRVGSDVPPPFMQEFELHAVIHDVLGHMNASFDTEIAEVQVRADVGQVRQILYNLLSNAIKYGKAPMKIAAWQEDAEVVICIRDSGPGIPAEQIPALFEKFSRLKRDVAGPKRGIGLGLYICRRFVEGMGGKIWVESAEGKGSSFYFTLPLAQRKSEDTP